MGSSNPSKIYDRLRQDWIVATPEERVRQQLLEQLLGPLGYPKERIAVEISLKTVAREGSRAPLRRLDILCFDAQFRPLLLVECKAGALTSRVLAQVLGYNHWVGARFVAVANPFEIRVKSAAEATFRLCSVLPTLSEAEADLSANAVAYLPL